MFGCMTNEVGFLYVVLFVFSIRKQQTSCTLVTGVQTCALPFVPRRRLPRDGGELVLRAHTGLGGEAENARNRRDSGGAVARQYGRRNPRPFQRGDRFRDIGTQRVGEADDDRRSPFDRE